MFNISEGFFTATWCSENFYKFLGLDAEQLNVTQILNDKQPYLRTAVIHNAKSAT